MTSTANPHLTHFIHSLIASTPPPQHTSPPNHLAQPQPQHPLSVSSSGESDSSNSNENSDDDERSKVLDKTPSKTPGVSLKQREDVVKRIVELLDAEQEEEIKSVLGPFLGDLAKDETTMEQITLDCMHRHKDDVDQLPFHPHLTPSRARASPSLSNLPLRPYTPTRVPSFRSRASTPLGRPQSPGPSLFPPQPTSANVSPVFSAAHPAPSSSGQSSGGSPISSPRMLNVKAATFNPTPSPRLPSSPAAAAGVVDPWSVTAIRRAGSPAPLGGPGNPFSQVAPSMSRSASNLAIAAPLTGDHSSPFHSPIGTPLGTPTRLSSRIPDVFSSPLPSPLLSHPMNGGVHQGSSSLIPDDDDDDEFSPFGTGMPKPPQSHTPTLSGQASAFQPYNGNSSGGSYFNQGATESDPFGDGVDPAESASVGMTPLDVLSSVFTSLSSAELEDALIRTNYDFESAMGMLVSVHSGGPRSGASTPVRTSSPRPGGMRPREGYFQAGGRAGGAVSPGLFGRGGPGSMVGGRVCRYFLAGECRRADCRFSHDVDRALCRFWLRGHCAKGENCEFIHHLPNLDPHALSNAMSHVELSSDGTTSRTQTPPPDEFPDLLAARLGRGQPARFDPARNRFANAVKKSAPPPPLGLAGIAGGRFSPAPGLRQQFSPASGMRTPPIAPIPRPSPRIKLRPPTLLPTLRTGATVNSLYMSARQNSIRLGQARNACLARAADAFRRGDGAAAKRFSREGKALNEKMVNEAAEAAQSLVRERRKEAQEAVRSRDPAWSDDPTDRTERGKECAAGLGVVMGVGSIRGVGSGGGGLSTAERTEVLLDLHTLHGPEGAEVLEEFLMALEKENFHGLAYIIVGEEKHVGTQDAGRGASRVRLAASIKEFLARWGYPWSEGGGVLCVDAATHY